MLSFKISISSGVKSGLIGQKELVKTAVRIEISLSMTVLNCFKRYITSRPKTVAGAELYMLSKDLLHIDNEK